MKSTKVTELTQSGEGDMHEVPRLRTKVRGIDKGADKPRPLEDIYSLRIKGRDHSWATQSDNILASQASKLLAAPVIKESGVREVGGRGGSL